MWMRLGRSIVFLLMLAGAIFIGIQTQSFIWVLGWLGICVVVALIAGQFGF